MTTSHDGTPKVTVRPWERRDREAVESLLRELLPTADLVSESAPVHVAELEGAVVGMVTLCIFDTLTGPKAYIDHLAVAPAARRRGVGRALVQDAIREATEARASRVDLTANEDKKAARALYESLGFQIRDTSSFRLRIAAERPR